MKSVTLAELEADLERNPEDWSIRLRLIEGHVLEGDKDAARRLVRESPDDTPLPPELQFRLHTVMTQGSPAVERYYAEQHGGESPFVRGDRKQILPLPPKGCSEEGNDGAEKNRDSATGDFKKKNKLAVEVDETRSQPAPKKAGGGDTRRGRRKRKQNARRSPKKTDAAAAQTIAQTQNSEALEAAEPMSVPAAPSGAKNQPDDVKVYRPKPKPATNPAGFAFVEEPEDDDAARLSAAAREPQAGQKVSAFTMALIAHFGLAVLGGFVVVNLPQTEPPQIVAVNVMAEREPVIAPRLVERDVPKAASASAPPASIVSSSAPSDFSVPEFDVDRSPDLTMLMTGVDAGQGMSFTGEGQESNVNFFGIRSGGKRIAFVVDATRYMLVDEKGGMFAYDKVKAEVAAMLALLKRGTAFNIILYEGKNLSLFSEEPVAAKPSAIRLASEWLDTLNRDYDQLGLRGRSGSSGQISEGVGIIEARDNLGYAKAIQLALEMDVNAVFAISSGYQRITRSLSPEQLAEVRKMNQGRTTGSVSKSDRDRWNSAQAKTRAWLEKENDARASKGLAPKVVINFNGLVRQVTGQSPPRATGGDTSPPPKGMPRPGPPYTPEEIEKHIEKVVVHFFKETNKAVPEIHMVLFLGEDEDLGDAKDHFRRLTRRNKGKLQILKGLAALSDVTGKE